MATDRAQLCPEDWLMAGFRALAQGGPGTLRAEALARALKTTKGSFYWHFADVADFRDRMLRYWEARAYDDVVDRLDSDATAATRLRQLCAFAVGYRDPIYGGAALEPAMRAWARADPVVAHAVQRMDTRRIGFVADLCQGCGQTDPELPRLLYAVIVGLESMDMAATSIEAGRNVKATLALLDALGIV